MLPRFSSLGIVALLLLVFVPGGVFAETGTTLTGTNAACMTSTICSSSPKELTSLLTFARQVVMDIKTIGTEGAYIGKYVNPDRYQGNIFVAPKETMLSMAVRNANQKLDAVVADAVILSSFQSRGGIKDSLAGVTVLFKNKAFQRDLARIEEVQKLLVQKRYEIGVGGGRYTKLNAKNLAQLQAVFAYYVRQGVISDAEVKEGVTYGNVTSLIARLLSALQTFVAIGSTDQFGTSWERGGQDAIKLSVPMSLISSMNSGYDCARGIDNFCDKNLAVFKAAMSGAVATNKTAVTKFMASIKASSQRLMQILTNKQSKENQAKQDALVRSYYGTNQLSSGDSHITTGGNVFSAWRKLWAKEKDIAQLPAVKQQVVAKTGSSAGVLYDALDQGMDSLWEHVDRDAQIVAMVDVSDISQAFAALDAKIKKITNMSTAVQTSLKASADLQCSQ